MGKNNQNGVSRLSLVPDSTEENHPLDRFDKLDESVLLAMSQDDARMLLDELEHEEVDGPTEKLINDTEYPPSVFIDLVSKANMAMNNAPYDLTVPDMKKFMGLTMSAHDSIRAATSIVKSRFLSALFRKHLPLYRDYFLTVIDMREEGEIALAESRANEARRSILKLV